jgi:hypothetical protein
MYRDDQGRLVKVGEQVKNLGDTFICDVDGEEQLLHQNQIDKMTPLESKPEPEPAPKTKRDKLNTITITVEGEALGLAFQLGNAAQMYFITKGVSAQIRVQSLDANFTVEV